MKIFQDKEFLAAVYISVVRYGLAALFGVAAGWYLFAPTLLAKQDDNPSYWVCRKISVIDFQCADLAGVAERIQQLGVGTNMETL